MICTPKVGLNNQLTNVQIFYDQIQLASRTLRYWINQFNYVESMG